MVYEEKIESLVLAGCLLEQQALETTLPRIRTEMFYRKENQLIFDAICCLHGEGEAVDILTVAEHLRRRGTLDEAGGPLYITQLSGMLASTAHLEAHCALLFEYYVRRELDRQLMPLMADVNNVVSDVFDLIVRMQKILESLVGNSPLESHLHTLPRVMKQTLEVIKHRQATAVDGLTGITTGFAELDRRTGGWQKGNLIYVAGRPGDGKSAVMLHMARAAAASGVPVLFYTLEMQASEIGERMALAETGVDPLRMKQGRLTQIEVEAVERCVEQAHCLPLCVDDTPYLGIDHLCTLVRAQRAKGNCGLVIVDYLQLLGTAAPGRTREQEVAECSRKLKALARTIDCPVIVASQLNRQAEEQPAPPDLRHLRESGAIEQDADIVMLIHRPERHHITVDPRMGCSTRGMGILNVAKHRNGTTGYVYYAYNESMTRFGEFHPVPPSEEERRQPAAKLSSRYLKNSFNPKNKSHHEPKTDLFGGSDS